MTPAQRTPQQRDRRFARVRHITQAIFLGSCATSVLFVGYAANAAHVVTTVPENTVPTTTPTPTPTTTPHHDVTTTTERTTPTTQGTVRTTPTTQRAVPTTPTTLRKVAPTTLYSPPTTAPVTTTTVCQSTPSGRVICF